MEQERLIYLLSRFSEQTATDAERRELTDRMAAAGENDLPADYVNQLLDEYAQQDGRSEPAWEELYQRIMSARSAMVHTAPVRVPLLKRQWLRYGAVAAMLAGVLAMLYYNLWYQPPAETEIVRHADGQEILPGANGAVLTLGDGTRLVLDSLSDGRLAAEEGSMAILKEGRLLYDPLEEGSAEVRFNSLTTPKGRQFQLTLPDGTGVWLNAGSSIRYPTAFNGKERRVEVKGEVYMEVAQDADAPFLLNIADRAEVAVLGTRFNVNAYDNEALVTTTLLQGRVRVNGVIIKPGELAAVDKPGERPQVMKADLSKAIAWKNGLFNFEGARLQEVMKQLERWYDIEVVYAGAVPDITFGGEMTRNISLQGLLVALETSGVKYKLEGRKLIILP